MRAFGAEIYVYILTAYKSLKPKWKSINHIIHLINIRNGFVFLPFLVTPANSPFKGEIVQLVVMALVWKSEIGVKWGSWESRERLRQPH